MAYSESVLRRAKARLEQARFTASHSGAGQELLINLGGSWYHIDPTPSRVHSRYSLMTDEQRYSTLSGRDWDRSKWPSCG